MRLPASEKLAIVRLVEQSHRPARRALNTALAPHVFCLFFHATGRFEFFDAAVVQFIEVIFVFSEDDELPRESPVLQRVVPAIVFQVGSIWDFSTRVMVRVERCHD